jgi:hypothetical protein
VAAADDGTIALGYGALDYRLALVPNNGGATILGGRPLPMEELPPLSEEEWERRRREIITFLDRMNPPPTSATRERMLEGVRTRPAPSGPRYRAHFVDSFDGALRFDGSGRLWVRTTRGNFSDQTVFDLFDRHLDYLGEVIIEDILTHWHIGTTMLVGSVLDDLGVAFVRVWTIR